MTAEEMLWEYGGDILRSPTMDQERTLSLIHIYALPYDIEFRAELPKTLVGKVAYRVLEEEELKKLSETAQE